MSACRVCGTDTNLPIECSFCGKHHCAKHRLPEKHDCDHMDRVHARGRDRNWVSERAAADIKKRATGELGTPNDLPPLELSRRRNWMLKIIFILSGVWTYFEFLTGASTMRWIVAVIIFLVAWIVLWVFVVSLFGHRVEEEADE